MCVAIRVPASEASARIRRLIEYFDPRRKEIVFDLFCEIPGCGSAALMMLHRGNVDVSLETGSLFGEPTKNEFVSLVAKRSEQLHSGIGWLRYARTGMKIVLPKDPRSEGSGVEPHAGSDEGQSFQCLKPADPTLVVRRPCRQGSTHCAFTVWEIGRLPRCPFALRIYLKMSGETAKALTGSSVGQAPEFFWIYGDSLLLDAAEGELGGASDPLLAEFRHLKGVSPEVFEYIEMFADDRDKVNYTAYPLSVNTFPQPIPTGLDGSTNWFVLTPYHDDESEHPVAPYGRFEIRFDSVVRS